jgi:hypothetical protein
MMVRSSETSVHILTTHRCMLGDGNVRNHLYVCVCVCGAVYQSSSAVSTDAVGGNVPQFRLGSPQGVTSRGVMTVHD